MFVKAAYLKLWVRRRELYPATGGTRRAGHVSQRSPCVARSATDTSKEVSDVDHLRVFASEEVAMARGQ